MNIGLINLRVVEDLLNRLESTMDEALAKLLKTGTRDV